MSSSSLLPGLKPVLELLDTAPQKIDLILLHRDQKSQEAQSIQKKCQQHGIRCRHVDKVVLDRFCRDARATHPIAHQGVVARLTAASYVPLTKLLEEVKKSPLPLILALDQVQDAGNVGTLCRTLYTLGGAGLLLPQHNSAALGAACARSAAGALEKLPVARVTNLGVALDSLEEAGLTIYGSAGLGSKTTSLYTATLSFPCVLVLGNEQHGMRPFVAKRCQSILAIPQARSFDSLNVAQAGAILIGHFSAYLYNKNREQAL